MIGVHYLFTRCARGLLAGSKIRFSIRELFFFAFYFLVYTTVCPLDALAALC